MSDLIDIYHYIRHCLFAHYGRDDSSVATTRDLQHDIFLYMVEIKRITNFNAGSRRFIYLLAKYRPMYLKRYHYSRSAEQVLLSEDGNPLDIGVSQAMTGDVSYDLELIERLKHQQVTEPRSANARPLLVTYIDDSKVIYPSLTSFAEVEGCSIFTALLWLKKPKFKSKNGKKDKYGHIVKIEYMNYTNPFPGSQTKIKKKLGDKSWEERTDHSDFELEDEHEYAKLYVHKESGEGWLVKIKAPKGAEYYIKRNM